MPVIRRIAFGACVLAALLAWQGAAVAEVCDKMALVPQNWEPAMGPHSWLVPYSRLVLPLIAGGLVALVTWYLRLRSVANMISIALASMGVLFVGWTFSGNAIDEARGAALAEGCYSIGADMFSTTVLLVGAFLFGIIGRRMGARVNA